MKDIGGLMKTMQAVQQKVANATKQMEQLEAEGKSGGGLVVVSLKGENNLQSIKIDP